MIPEGIQIVSGVSHISYTVTVGVGNNDGQYNFANMANNNDNNQPAPQYVPVPGFVGGGQQISAVFWSPFDNMAALSSFRFIDVEQSDRVGQVFLTAWGYHGSNAVIRIKITALVEGTFTS